MFNLSDTMARPNKVMPRPDFNDTISRNGLTVSSLSKQAGIGYITLYGVLNPKSYRSRGTGGMRLVTAWKIAKAFAAHTGSDDDAAFAKLFYEVPPDYQQPVE